jgi:hypothetical protein
MEKEIWLHEESTELVKMAGISTISNILARIKSLIFVL